MKNTFLMCIVGLTVIVDAIKNYVLNAPINDMGILLGSIVVLYFVGLLKEKS